MKKEDGKKAEPKQEPKHEQTTNTNEVTQAPQPVATTSSSQKDFLVAAMLSLFLGWFGVDRFYLGFVGSGILKLVTFGGCGLWYLIDLILILAGGLKSADKQELKGRDKNLKIALIITGVVFAFGLITSAVSSAIRPVTTNQSGSQSTQQPEQKKEEPKKEEPKKNTSELNATVKYSATAFQITNNEEVDWVNCKVKLNSDYVQDNVTFPKKDSVILAFRDFTKGDGTRFNSVTTAPKSVYITSCDGENSGRDGYFGI